MDDALFNFKLEAYKSLREEINQHWQAMGAVVGVALTATAAIGAFGLSKTGNRDALLILPFVLSGLGLVQVNHGIQVRRLGEYIRTYLWPSPADVGKASGAPMPPPSYEEWMARMRLAQPDLYPTKAAGFIGYTVVFALPSIGALAITAAVAWRSTPLTAVWVAAAVVLAAATAWSNAVEQVALGPSDRYPQEEQRPSKTLEPRPDKRRG